MKLGLAVIGALLGMWAAASSGIFLGAVVGFGFGLLLAQVRQLSNRVSQLERGDRREEEPPFAKTSPAPVEPIRVPPETASTPADSEPVAIKTPPLPDPEPYREAPAEPPPPSALGRFSEAVRGWLTTGNVPVKVGVVVSFFGVAFLLQYAMGRVPMEVRLLAVATGAIGLLALGWRLRERFRVYGLSLQGGGVGVLYLTIFAAFRLYDLLPPTLAFLLLVALTAFAGLISVLQDARALAVLGIVGGFLAPVLVSTGSGNHVALFSYYLVLNLAILGIARFRAWRELNLLGFLFTFIIGSLWGRSYYRPELFGSTEPFLIAHFLLYQAVAVLFALRQPPNLRGWVDGTLVFGTPVVAFALQAALVRDTEYGLAISAVAVGLFYSVLTHWLWRRHRETLRLMTESYLALAIAFGTIAIPLALDARWTAAAWALEGAALVWVATRQHRLLPKLAGGALLILAGASFAEYGWKDGVGMAVLNGNLLGGLLIAWSSLLSARFLGTEPQAPQWQRYGGILLFLWGAAWWLGSGALEIEDRASGADETHLLVLWIAVSGLICSLVGNRRDWALARTASLAHLPLLIGAGLLYLVNGRHPFVSWGIFSWAAALLVQVRILWDYEVQSVRTAGRWHGATALSLAALLSWETYWQVDARLSDVWAGSAASLVAAALVGAILAGAGRVAWPINRHWPAYRVAAGLLVAAELLFVWLMVINDGGNPSPLPYVPLLNPYDVATLVGLLMGLWWLVHTRREADALTNDQWKLAGAAWGVIAFILTTIAVVRGVLQVSGIDWRPSSMFDSVAVQAALSIYWGLLGVLGMVLGARRQRRPVWLIGASLMGLVVIKLFTIDLGNTETVARIVSFVGVGALLLVVGYFAPAPPRASAGHPP